MAAAERIRDSMNMCTTRCDQVANEILRDVQLCVLEEKVNCPPFWHGLLCLLIHPSIHD